MGQSYVVQGAALKCTFGNQKGNFSAVPGREVFIREKQQGNIMDFKPNINIGAFGMCSSLANPVVAAATAANDGHLKKMPCVPATVMPWINGKIDVNVEKFPALLNTSTTTCMWCGIISVDDDGQ